MFKKKKTKQFLAQSRLRNTPLIQLYKSGNESHTEKKWPQPRPPRAKLRLFETDQKLAETAVSLKAY